MTVTPRHAVSHAVTIRDAVGGDAVIDAGPVITSPEPTTLEATLLGTGPTLVEMLLGTGPTLVEMLLGDGPTLVEMLLGTGPTLVEMVLGDEPTLEELLGQVGADVGPQGDAPVMSDQPVMT